MFFGQFGMMIFMTILRYSCHVNSHVLTKKTHNRHENHDPKWTKNFEKSSIMGYWGHVNSVILMGKSVYIFGISFEILTHN